MAVVSDTCMLEHSISFHNPSVKIDFFTGKNPVVQTIYNNGYRNVARASVHVMGTGSGYPRTSRKITVQDGHALHHAISCADIKQHYPSDIELTLDLREPALFMGIENTISIVLYYETLRPISDSAWLELNKRR